MRKTMKISEARKKLFDLMDEVTGDSDGAVVIEHRDKQERAVLISEERLRYLERVAGPSKNRYDDSKLAGSLELLIDPGDLEAAIDENREEQARFRAEEYRDLWSDG